MTTAFATCVGRWHASTAGRAFGTIWRRGAGRVAATPPSAAVRPSARDDPRARRRDGGSRTFFEADPLDGGRRVVDVDERGGGWTRRWARDTHGRSHTHARHTHTHTRGVRHDSRVAELARRRSRRGVERRRCARTCARSASDFASPLGGAHAASDTSSAERTAACVA